jgi:hypothetical protein
MDYRRFFPSLVDIHWEEIKNIRPLNLNNLGPVTRISRGLQRHSPFELLSHLPEAKMVNIFSFDHEPFRLVPFECRNLTDLELTCLSNDWTFDELKAAFTFFPNMTSLALKVRSLSGDFSEQVNWPTFGRS